MFRQPPSKRNPFGPVVKPPRRRGFWRPYALAATIALLVLLVFVALVVALIDRQNEVSRQANTIRAQQTAIAKQQTAIAKQQTAIAEQVATASQQRAELATQASRVSAQQTAIGTQAAALSQKRAQLAKQQTQIVALQTQVAILRTSLTVGSSTSPPPLQPLLDQTWLVRPEQIALQAGTRKGQDTLSFRFALENATGHAVKIDVRRQVYQVLALGPQGPYALRVIPLPQGIPTDIRVSPHYRVSYIASADVPGNSTLSGFSIMVADIHGVALTYTRK